MSGVAAEVARPLSRRWRAGALTPAPGFEMEISLPKGLNLQEVDLIPIFYRLYLQHLEDGGSSVSGLAADVPAWAVELFENGVPWCSDSIASLTADLVQRSQTLKLFTSWGTQASDSLGCSKTLCPKL